MFVERFSPFDLSVQYSIQALLLVLFASLFSAAPRAHARITVETKLNSGDDSADAFSDRDDRKPQLDTKDEPSSDDEQVTAAAPKKAPADTKAGNESKTAGEVRHVVLPDHSTTNSAILC